jgi:hypothetical protein
MAQTIHLGYEVGTGRPVRIPADRHIGITGQTQRSGKTTTLEALISRSDGCALAFITKRGESSFHVANPIPAFFRDPLAEKDPDLAPWQFVLAILEARMRQPLKMHRSFIMNLCNAHHAKDEEDSWQRPRSLQDVLKNCSIAHANARGGFERGIYTELEEFLKIALPEIQSIQRATEKSTWKKVKDLASLTPPDEEKKNRLQLAPGLNVMDVHKFSEDTQGLIIAACLWDIFKYRKNVRVILPEAQTFLPQTMKESTTPVAQVAEKLARQGAGVGNFLLLDSQDMAGVNKVFLRAVGVWIFGVQGEQNEIERLLKMIPKLGERVTPTQIMTLKRGHFLARWDDKLIHTYVQPAFVGDDHAIAIAKGDEDVESVREIERNKFGSAATHPRQGDSEKDPAGAESEPEAAAPGAHGSAPPDEEDEVDYKSEFLRLKQTYDYLEDEYDKLKRRVAELETSQAHPVSPTESEHGVHLPDKGINAKPGGYPSESEIMKKSHLQAEPNGTGIRVKTKADPEWRDVDPAALVDAIWQPLRQKALAEAPIILHLMAQRPEMQVEVARATVKAEGDSVMGRVAMLIHDGWFATARTGPMVQKEMERRGCKQPTTNLYRACDKLAEMGFLTKEAEGYLETREAKARIEA